MTEAERLLDTNVLVHAYIRLDEQKQVSANAIVMPIWESGGASRHCRICASFSSLPQKIARPMPIGQAENIVREHSERNYCFHEMACAGSP